MREVCVVPTFNRSEFLWCCLEAIRAAEPDIPIIVYPDRGTRETETCLHFNARQKLTIEHSYHGNSFNLLEAMKEVYFMQAETVFIVEDDAIIDPSFFSWARNALTKHPECFAACGWQYSPDAIISDGPDLIIPWYLSVCSAIQRNSLYGIIQHARPEYYSDMGGYLDRTYPNSNRRGTRHYEQDGLVLRTAESESKPFIWPRRPRATHIGWHGYHMGTTRVEGSLDERVALVKLALKNPSLLSRLMAGAVPPDMDHCARCDKPLLSENKEAIKVCVECFHKEHPELPVVSSSHYYLKESQCLTSP